MAKIVGAMASSHAFTFIDPRRWDERRQVTRERYEKKYGVKPPENPRVAEQTLAFSQERYQVIRDAMDRLKLSFAQLKPDALVVIGDDQNENYREQSLPQFAVYTGERFTSVDSFGSEPRDFESASGLATDILSSTVAGGVDMAWSTQFADQKLLSHAHAQVLSFLMPKVPVVLVFVNAINVPAPTPARCYEVGQQLRQAIEKSTSSERVVVYASGGLSHFTAGYPWSLYKGSYSLGSISEDFDRRLIAQIREGRGAQLGALSSEDLLANGDIELRQWIVLLGTLGTNRPEWIEYEPLYRAILGMAVGYWPLKN